MGSRAEFSFFKRGPKPEPSGDFLGESIGRRTFLARAGRTTLGIGLVASGTLNADTLIGNAFWGGTNPELGKIENNEAAKKFPHTWTLVVGGYNVENTDGLAASISPEMAKYSQVGYLKHSSQGLQMEDVKRAADRFVDDNKVTDMYLYGHSMGGMVSVELGAHLAQKDVNINGIIFDCSPLSYQDLRTQKRDAADILVFTDKMSIHGGPLTRFIIEMGARWSDGRRDIIRMCEDVIREINPSNCSNRYVQSQAEYMSQFRLEDYRDAFPSTTQFFHLRPDNYDADPTIDNQSSHQRLRTVFTNHNLFDLAVAGGGHANIGDCRPSYIDALHKAALYGNFYDGIPRRHYTLFE